MGSSGADDLAFEFRFESCGALQMLTIVGSYELHEEDNSDIPFTSSTVCSVVLTKQYRHVATINKFCRPTGERRRLGHILGGNSLEGNLLFRNARNMFE